MSSRTLSRCVLGIAAAASIATSSLPDVWHVSDARSVPTTTFDPQVTTQRYAVRAELYGEGDYTELSGLVNVWLSARVVTDSASPAEIRVRIRSTTHPDPDLDSSVTGVFVDRAAETSSSIPVWVTCSAPPCTEDLELTVEIVQPAEASRIDVYGSISLIADGDDLDLEPHTAATVTITPLEPPP